MLTLTTTILAQVADKARSDASAHPRWISAISRALIELENNPWIERNADGHGLLIGSPSGKVYSSNGICQCEAYAHGRACWHRAAARLVRLHDERIAAGPAEQCPSCCADRAYADRCPAAQIAADQQAARLARKIAAQRAAAQLNELFA